MVNRKMMHRNNRRRHNNWARKLFTSYSSSSSSIVSWIQHSIYECIIMYHGVRESQTREKERNIKKILQFTICCSFIHFSPFVPVYLFIYLICIHSRINRLTDWLTKWKCNERNDAEKWKKSETENSKQTNYFVIMQQHCNTAATLCTSYTLHIHLQCEHLFIPQKGI